MSLAGLGAALPWLGLAAALGALACQALALRGRPGHPATGLERLALWLWVAAAAATLAALGLLASLFLAGDLSVATVFFYTRTDLDWPWRLAGTWAGRQGSLLLWTAALAAVAAAVAWLDRNRVVDGAEARERGWLRLFLGLALAAFLGAVATQGTFAATSPALLAGRPLGNGLNPTLRSGFILIHPPLMFLAYALSTVPAAAALASLVAGTGRWSRTGLGPSRLAWLAFTVAIALGALWAYTTLGFGGYWAWDPVEVANLLPWLALTLHLHAQLRHRDAGAFPAAGPLLAVLPFLLSVFSTLSTRSGLWVSVHAFTDPTDTFEPDALRRFLAILDVEPSLRFHASVFLATLLGFLALWTLRLAADAGRLRRAAPLVAAAFAGLAAWSALDAASFLSAAFELARAAALGSTAYGLLALVFLLFLAAASPALSQPSAPASSAPPVRRRMGIPAFAAYSVLALALALTVLLLFHFAAVNGWSPAYYEGRFPFLALPVVLGLLVFQLHPLLGSRTALAAAAGSLLLALAAWRLTGSILWVLLVPALAAAVASLARTRAALAPPRGAPLLLLAALANTLFWTNPPTHWVDAGWMAQAILLGASLAGLWMAARLAAGEPMPAGAVALAVALPCGYLAAPALALAGWLRGRGRAQPARPAVSAARLQQASVQAFHLGIALLLCGYAVSTYARAEARSELRLGESLHVGGVDLAFDGAALRGGAGGAADGLHPLFTWRSHGWEGRMAGNLEWERQAQAHLARPGIARTALTDLFVDVEAVHVAGGGSCVPGHPDGYWLAANAGQVPSRACPGSTLDAVRLRAVTLPGLSLLWGGVAVAAAAMAVRLRGARPARAP